jgi:hypothetical protein
MAYQYTDHDLDRTRPRWIDLPRLRAAKYGFTEKGMSGWEVSVIALIGILHVLVMGLAWFAQ